MARDRKRRFRESSSLFLQVTIVVREVLPRRAHYSQSQGGGGCFGGQGSTESSVADGVLSTRDSVGTGRRRTTQGGLEGRFTRSLFGAATENNRWERVDRDVSPWADRDGSPR